MGHDFQFAVKNHQRPICQATRQQDHGRSSQSSPNIRQRSAGRFPQTPCPTALEQPAEKITVRKKYGIPTIEGKPVSLNCQTMPNQRFIEAALKRKPSFLDMSDQSNQKPMAFPVRVFSIGFFPVSEPRLCHRSPGFHHGKAHGLGLSTSLMAQQA